MSKCTICFRQLKRTGEDECEGKNGKEYLTEGEEMAPEIVVTQPGFLSTFNQIKSVLESSSSCELSLESVIMEGSAVSLGTKSPEPIPRFCHVCCSKVVNVANLMKALRQQVREIKALSEYYRIGGYAGTTESKSSEAVKSFGHDHDDHCDDIYENDDQNTNSPAFQDDNNETMSTGGDEEDKYVKLEQDNQDEILEQSKLENAQAPLSEVKIGPIPKKRREVKKDAADSSKPFPCNESSCNRSFNTKSGLYFHKVRFHPNLVGSELLVDGDDGKNQDNRFPCSCGMTFKTNGRRVAHMRRNKRMHSNLSPEMITGLEKSQRCDMCPQKVSFASIFEHYKIEHFNGHGEYVMKCPNSNCLYMFTTYNCLRRHRRTCKYAGKMNAVKLKCDTCGFIGSNTLSLRNHVENVHELFKAEKKWKCPVSGCEKMFCVKQSVSFHVEVHRTAKVITTQTCDKCGEDISVEEMEEHLKKTHEISEVIGCKQCSFKFGDRDVLADHLFEHRAKGILCDVCDNQVKYYRYMDFREHYFGVHGLCEKSNKCEQCDGMFWRKDTLKMHISKRHNQKNEEEVKVMPRKVRRYKCDLCLDGSLVSFDIEHHLISHKIKLHGMEPFTCESCEMTFIEKAKLTRHVKKEHAGVQFKEWKCDVEGCGKQFRIKCHLRQHIDNNHWKDKKFICDVCGKGYVTNGDLKRHTESIHLGLRPWMCEECGEGFTIKKVLETHKLIHTEERPFGCEFCGQRFRQKVALDTHVKGHQTKGAAFKPSGPMKGIRKRKAK